MNMRGQTRYYRFKDRNSSACMGERRLGERGGPCNNTLIVCIDGMVAR